MKTLREKSVSGRPGHSVHGPAVKKDIRVPKSMARSEISLPELSESQVIRHYHALAKMNYGVDDGFYPLGSCTMKYNPRINEDVARFSGFANIHPMAPNEHCQGALRLMHELSCDLCELTGMDAFTLTPAAGAHGELTGLMMMTAHFKKLKEKRTKIIVPDSSHGTNPATAGYLGYEVVVVGSDDKGDVDMDDLNDKMSDDIAGLMLTNPNTLGLFEPNIMEITDIVHEAGGLVYYDGANMNAIMGITRPADMGYDLVHLNLHKTFATPHGGGGPGAGPVGVTKDLERYLPKPKVIETGGRYSLDWSGKDSIGMVRAFNGSFGVLVRAYAYIRSLGGQGLKEASEMAVLNANYLKKKLEGHYEIPFNRSCMHEFVLSASKQAHEHNVRALDIGKRLLDLGFHAPTVYFPLIVEEAMMIEPTETETKEVLDEFADAMIKIAKECEDDPEMVRSAPKTTPVSRLDDTLAARKPVLTWNMKRD